VTVSQTVFHFTVQLFEAQGSTYNIYIYCDIYIYMQDFTWKDRIK
jgi:hypothetical protein